MKEKILALLVAKFAGVRKDGLARLAQSLALQAENDTEAGALVEKLTTEKVNEFVTDYRKDVDKEVSDANKTYEGTLKKKFEFVEKKNDDDDPAKKSKSKTDDETPAWAKTLIEKNEALEKKLSAFESGKTAETRLQQLQSKLSVFPEGNKIAEQFKAQKIKDIGFMNFESEEKFTEYLNGLDTDISGLNQEIADAGLSGHSRPLMGGQNKDGVSSAVASFIESKTDDKKVLTGKEI